MKTNKIAIAKFGKTHGVKGWIRVYPIGAIEILAKRPWYIKKNNAWVEIKIEDSKPYAGYLLIKIANINDPETAKNYTNNEIYLEQELLPKLKEDQYYWSQLEGLTIIDQAGKVLGKVDHLVATGANDVLVLVNNKKEHFIPYIKNVVLAVDLANKTIKVDWDLAYLD
jgi:16S rRNA processing protein RimM